MEHLRDTEEWLARNERRQEVQELYFAVKHPTLARIFQQLRIEVKDPVDHNKMAELNEQERHFSLYDFEQAIDKLRRHLGWDKAHALTEREE